MLASRYVQLSSAETMRQYEQKYQALSGRADVTEQDMRELDALFKEINSAESIKADLIDFVIKYSTLFLVLIPFTLYAAKRFRLEEGPMFIAAALIFLAFILFGLMVTGAVIATLFFIASSIFARKRRQGG